jgi:hypothetical protein
MDKLGLSDMYVPSTAHEDIMINAPDSREAHENEKPASVELTNQNKCCIILITICPIKN